MGLIMKLALFHPADGQKIHKSPNHPAAEFIFGNTMCPRMVAHGHLNNLMPELQGRFPIRVELADLEQADYVRILREPKNSLVRQQIDLLAVEGVRISFTDDAIYAMAEYAFNVNRNTQNIGARRLNTILDRVMDDLSFMASEIRGEKHVIDATMVREKLADIASDEDLSRYVL